MVDKLTNMNRHLRTGILLGGFWFLFFILAFTFLGILIYTNIKHARKYSNSNEKSLGKALIQYDFVADDSYMSDDFLSGIAINESENRIAIFK